MDDYLNTFREMISLRGLTDHTVTSYSTYIRAYLDYLANILHKMPVDVSWEELRDFIRWLQKDKNLSDRTMNACISQIRFFYTLCPAQTLGRYTGPTRRFDTYLPYVPSQDEVWRFISTMPDLKQKTMTAVMYSSGLRIGEVYHLRYEDIKRKNLRIHIRHSKARQDRYAILSHTALELLTRYWFEYGRPMGWLFPKRSGIDKPIDTFFSRVISMHMSRGWGGRNALHAILSSMRSAHIFTKTAQIFSLSKLCSDINR